MLKLTYEQKLKRYQRFLSGERTRATFLYEDAVNAYKEGLVDDEYLDDCFRTLTGFSKLEYIFNSFFYNKEEEDEEEEES